MQTCPICYFDLDVIENIYETECLHKYHHECIKMWYFGDHVSCKTCPMCRKQLHLNITDLNIGDDYVTDIEKFIALNGVFLINDTIFIDVENSGWKDLLKNLLMLITLQNRVNSLIQFERSNLIIKYNNRNLKFGFLLNDVNYRHISKIGESTQVKMALSNFRYFQFENLKHLSKIISMIAHDTQNPMSFIKKQISKNMDVNNNINIEDITSQNSVIYVKLPNFTEEMKLKNKFNGIFNFVQGRCNLALIPSIIQLNGKTYYDLRCIDFMLLSRFEELNI